RWGDPELVAIKRGGPEAPGGSVSSRHAQGARRIAEAQARYRRGEIIEGSASDDEDDEATA
ncbi:hypothetical protein MKK51_22120, partial [Methylobacterium sp. E-045]|nr:hypothetical protein [Methylobacterium sp. E-045]MCJ2131516.1 hypothetical protein [Methylobacterium sp. E-045]